MWSLNIVTKNFNSSKFYYIILCMSDSIVMFKSLFDILFFSWHCVRTFKHELQTCVNFKSLKESSEIARLIKSCSNWFKILKHWLFINSNFRRVDFVLPFFYFQRFLSSFIDFFSTFFFIMFRKKLIEKKKKNWKNEIIRVRWIVAQTAYVINFFDILIVFQTFLINSDFNIVVEIIVTAITSHLLYYNNFVISQFHFKSFTFSFLLFSFKSAIINLIDQKKNSTNVKQNEKKDRICQNFLNLWFIYID